MKLPDVNLLLYATDETSSWHEPARAWLEAVLNEAETVAFAWNVLLAFLRLTTKAQVMAHPMTVSESLAIIDGWLGLPNVVVVHPTDRHSAMLRELLNPLGTGGNLTTDAHLAALAIAHGAQLCSSDSDFSRFARLNWLNPLAAP